MYFDARAHLPTKNIYRVNSRIVLVRTACLYYQTVPNLVLVHQQNKVNFCVRFVLLRYSKPVFPNVSKKTKNSLEFTKN